MDSVAVLLAGCFLIEGELYVYEWTSNATDYSLARYDSLFKKHGTTPEIFMQNVKYYLTNKKYADIIMDKVDKIVDQHAAALREPINLEQ